LGRLCLCLCLGRSLAEGGKLHAGRVDVEQSRQVLQIAFETSSIEELRDEKEVGQAWAITMTEPSAGPFSYDLVECEEPALDHVARPGAASFFICAERFLECSKYAQVLERMNFTRDQ